MASLCRQILRGNAFKGVLVSAARRGYADKMMPDPLEHATGLEQKELLALQAGNDDPFNIKVLKKTVGTRESPTLVPSCFEARIVGCICEEHSTAINWLWLHKIVYRQKSRPRAKVVTELWCPQAGLTAAVKYLEKLGFGDSAHSLKNASRGNPRRCECGHWYKLTEKAPL